MSVSSTVNTFTITGVEPAIDRIVVGNQFADFTAWNGTEQSATGALAFSYVDTDSPQPVILSMTAIGIPNGTYATRIINPANDTVVYSDNLAWSGESASVTLTGVATSTALEWYVLGVTDGAVNRGVAS